MVMLKLLREFRFDCKLGHHDIHFEKPFCPLFSHFRKFYGIFFVGFFLNLVEELSGGTKHTCFCDAMKFYIDLKFTSWHHSSWCHERTVMPQEKQIKVGEKLENNVLDPTAQYFATSKYIGEQWQKVGFCTWLPWKPNKNGFSNIWRGSR